MHRQYKNVIVVKIFISHTNAQQQTQTQFKMSRETTYIRYRQTGIEVLCHHHGNKTVCMQLLCSTYLSLWKPSPWCSWWLVHEQVSYNPRPPALPHCVHAFVETGKERHTCRDQLRHTVAVCARSDLKSDALHPVTHLRDILSAYSHIAKERRKKSTAWWRETGHHHIRPFTQTHPPISLLPGNSWICGFSLMDIVFVSACSFVWVYHSVWTKLSPHVCVNHK